MKTWRAQGFTEKFHRESIERAFGVVRIDLWVCLRIETTSKSPLFARRRTGHLEIPKSKPVSPAPVKKRNLSRTGTPPTPLTNRKKQYLPKKPIQGRIHKPAGEVS